MQHWYEYSAYFAHGALIALHREWFHAHARRFLLPLSVVALALFFVAGDRNRLHRRDQAQGDSEVMEPVHHQVFHTVPL